MVVSTRLLTAISIAGVVCRTVHTVFPEDLKILRMTEVPLRHLLFRNLCMSASVPETSLSKHPEKRQKFVKTMEPLLNACYASSNSSSCEVSLNLSMDVAVASDSTTRTQSLEVNLNMGCGKLLENNYLTLKQKYKAMRKWKIFGKEKQSIHPDEAFVLRLLSFNILAQHLLEAHSYLYKHHDKSALLWDTRKSLLLREIFEAEANVICLQEMQEEHLHDFLIPFKNLGYKYLYKKRTNDKKDGLLFLYRSDLFNLVDHVKVELYQSGVELLNRDNVGLIAKLSLKDSPDTQIVIATTHLLYNPRRNDVRLGQVQLLLTELERIAFIENTRTGAKYHPIILSGDFNSEPYTGIYKFITEGSFKYLGKGRDLEPAEYRSLSNLLIPPNLYITDNCQHFNILIKRLRNEGDGEIMLKNSEYKQINTKISTPNDRASFKKEEINIKSTNYQKIEIINDHHAKFASGSLTHPFNLCSVYNHTNRYGQMEATTNQGSWVTVDYIFFSDIEPLEKYTLPTVEECITLSRIPNVVVGSDHLCLGASFKLVKKKR